MERSRRNPELIKNIFHGRGYADRGLMALVTPDRLRRMLGYMLDENEFLGPHGVRALSRYHLEHPYIFNVNGQEYRVQYVPGDSDSGMFGGNSNWRGPVWMPMNIMLIRALLHLYLFYGDSFTVECPTRSGRQMHLFEVAREISRRLVGAFLRDDNGRRPLYGPWEKFQTDPHWCDHLIFPEYFHGDTGVAVGASHQTGWTGLVALLIQNRGSLDPAQVLKEGKRGAFVKKDPTNSR